MEVNGDGFVDGGPRKRSCRARARVDAVRTPLSVQHNSPIPQSESASIPASASRRRSRHVRKRPPR
eukprot:scaffold264106_cov32-Tisochrysis_lutea.AAC.2